MKNTNDVTLRQVGDFIVVLDSDGNPVEIYKDDGSLSSPQPDLLKDAPPIVGKIGAVSVDLKHPYVVIIGGTPIFSTSGIQSERLGVLIVAGIDPSDVQVLDTRNGKVVVFQKGKV